MLILLPPSEGKIGEGGEGSLKDCDPELVPDAKTVLKHVSGLSLSQRMKFYGLKDETKAKECHRLNLKVESAACMRALERYSGVVYQHLSYGTLKRKRKAESRIYVVSGLFGAISGATRIPFYKMPINTWLARFWKLKNGERITMAAGRRQVLSLLPQAYSKAVELDGSISVDFRIEGGRKAAGHSGKAIKGRFVRFLIENDIADVKDFSDFREEGFRFDGTNFVQK